MSFWEKITKVITRVNSRIFRIHPIYGFPDFPENGPSDNDYFREQFWKSYTGWIHKIINNNKVSKFLNGFYAFEMFGIKNIFLMNAHGNASLLVPIYVCWCFRFRVRRLNVWNLFFPCFHKKSPISTFPMTPSYPTEITIVKI